MPKIHARHLHLLQKSAISRGQLHISSHQDMVLMGGKLFSVSCFFDFSGLGQLFFNAGLPLLRFCWL